MNKYEILKNDSISVKNPINGLPVKLFRIIASKSFKCRDFDINEGSIGGYIEKEINLSQEDTSWVSQNACVFGNSTLEDSFVTDRASIFNNSKVKCSTITGTCKINNSNVDFSVINGNVDIFESNLNLTNCSNWAIVKKSNVVNSFIHNGSHVLNSSIEDSTLIDTADIRNSKITKCQIGGRTVINNQNLASVNRFDSVELQVQTG